MITVATAALGLTPLLMSSGVGSETQRPLATVVLGGLSSSMLATLFILPCIYRRIITTAANQDPGTSWTPGEGGLEVATKLPLSESI